MGILGQYNAVAWRWRFDDIPFAILKALTLRIEAKG